MTTAFESSVFGTLRLETEAPEYPVYTADCELPAYGVVTIALACLPDAPNAWTTLLRSAEELFPALVRHESRVREEAASEALRLHRESYGDEWQELATDLVSDIQLHTINFFSDGSVELWYSGGESFHFHDLRVSLDSDLHVQEVGLDG